MNQIKHCQFLTNLHACSEDMEYVASKIKDIIIAEITQKGMCVEIIPDVQRLVRMGFKSEFISIMTDLLINNESNRSQISNLFHTIINTDLISPIFKSEPARSTIYIESCTTENDIITTVYCEKYMLHVEDEMKWRTCLIHVAQLRSYYEISHPFSISDLSDHTGEHVQKLSNVPFERINEYDYQELVKDYIESGYEVVTL